MMKKIAIIGAGIFGFSTALELNKNNFDVTVFERTGVEERFEKEEQMHKLYNALFK